MDEILEKLLESEVLSEETKKGLTAAFQTKVTEAVEAAREGAATEVRAELMERWTDERNTLIEAVDKKVDELVRLEVDELREDIEQFRDLEAEHAQKLVEAKKGMANALKGDLAELIEKLDAFLEMRLSAEFTELREDLDIVKRDSFGRRVFEAFKDEFTFSFADEDDSATTLGSLREELDTTLTRNAALNEQIENYHRHDRMALVLKPLNGRPREVMEAILQNVPTNKLNEAYKTFIGRVLADTKQSVSRSKSSEKEGKVLAEGKNRGKSRTRVVTGDLFESEEEKRQASGATALNESTKARMKRLAGLD